MYKDLDKPVEVVENLAVNMQLFESHHIIGGNDIVYEHKPEVIIIIPLSRYKYFPSRLDFPEMSNQMIFIDCFDRLYAQMSWIEWNNEYWHNLW